MGWLNTLKKSAVNLDVHILTNVKILEQGKINVPGSRPCVERSGIGFSNVGRPLESGESCH